MEVDVHAIEKEDIKKYRNMKIAISSKSNVMSSELDARFGRCKYFVIYDTEEKSTTFIENLAAEQTEGAGPAAFKQLVSLGVKKIVSGDFGVKIKTLCSDFDVQLIIMREKHTIEEIIKLLNH